MKVFLKIAFIVLTSIFLLFVFRRYVLRPFSNTSFNADNKRSTETQFSTVNATATERTSSSPQGTQTSKKSEKINPFGVMIGGRKGMEIPKKIEVAKDLGVVYFRPNSIFLDRWDGYCEECDAATTAGLELVLTIRNNGGPQQPTTPPEDLNQFKQVLNQILDRYNPSVLVVENEENSEALFYNGSPEQYLEELTAACEVAHSKGTLCTNGGLVSTLVALMVVNDYYENGEKIQASLLFERTIQEKFIGQYPQLSKSDLSSILTVPKIKKQIDKGKTLISGYKTSGADYLNFHWYIADSQALGEVASYLKEASGLSVLTNEIGQQKNEDPTQVTEVMQKIVELNLPVAVWFSMDVPGYGEARSLADEEGNLRSNGIAFKNFIEQNY